jgi:drug/metabolite transporter (DMT)-like permease
VAVLLGVLVAAAFGSGDFIGGRASMHARAVAVLTVSQACAMVCALVLALLVSAHVTGHDVVLGVAAGVMNVIGLGLLYRGLVSAAMGVVAPVTAVAGAVVPITWGLAQGERPSSVVLVGIVVSVVAVALIAREPGEAGGAVAPGVAIAVAAGAALGTSLVLYAETSERSGMWPVFTARASAFALAALAFAWVARRHAGTRLPEGRDRAFALGAGVCDVAGTALLLVAVRRGLLTVVATLAALAPGFTVLLAWVVLREHLAVVQRVGLVLALAGLLLVSLG